MKKGVVIIVLVLIGTLILWGRYEDRRLHPRDFFVEHQVPFFSQAPMGNWSGLFQNTCEEAVILMVAGVRQFPYITPAEVEKKLINMVWYEEEQGIGPSMTLVNTQKLLQVLYGVESEMIERPTLDLMKHYLQYRGLIVPASGVVLANPNFRRPLPSYHMLLIIGYDDATGEFIVNDPGTRMGKSYRYAYDVVMDAMHDWTGSRETILKGRKRMLVVEL